ncbi:hypothetical protein [Ignatzschineria cameli]|uniref:Lipoprotein n=1 Tax=Ignatzschineria cameli TaxID=2182793 RepID=A0A2U2AL83_9GAMM|nr:hypothetical protein [Ignatzschineria cameli]PWD83972.1 hypothetical protein DC077_08125 [Ignatzschineria cameli]
MKKSALTYLTLTTTFSLILSACGTYPQQPYPYVISGAPMPSTEVSFPTEDRTVAIFDTPAIMMPTGNYGEVHTTKSSSTSGSSNTDTQGSCVENESHDFHTNGVSKTRKSSCSSSSQTKSTSKIRSTSSSVGFNVGGPVGAALGMIRQMEEINNIQEQNANEMFKAFGF